MEREELARRVGRIVMVAIVVVGVAIVILNREFFARPLPQDRFGIWGELLGSRAMGFAAKVALLSVLLAIPGSILGMMYQGRLLSKFWNPEAEPPTDAMESIADTDEDVAARLDALEDTVALLVELHKSTNGESDNP